LPLDDVEQSLSSSDEDYISSDHDNPVELQMLEAHSQAASKSKGTDINLIFHWSFGLNVFRKKT
jgi:hypothetical protein